MNEITVWMLEVIFTSPSVDFIGYLPFISEESCLEAMRHVFLPEMAGVTVGEATCQPIIYPADGAAPISSPTPPSRP